IVGFIQTAMVFVAIPFIKPLVKKFGKKETASAGMLLASIAYFTLYLLQGLPLPMFFGLLSVGMFGFAFFNLVIWAFVTDVIDYHEFLTDMREDATVYAVYSFARKVGQAIAGGLGGFAIAAVGYSAGAATQSQGVLDGIYMLGTLVPAIFFLVVFLLLVFVYPLNKKRVLELANNLEVKRNAKLQND
ncbi:MAG: MFS transporter, partial [Exiguobacterium mexicanum]